MPTETSPRGALSTSSPTIALTGLSEPEASYVLQRLAVALPDALIQRYDSLPAVVATVRASDTAPVVLVGSSLSTSERSVAAGLLQAASAAVDVLDVGECREQVLVDAQPRPAESLVAVAVRAALAEQPLAAAELSDVELAAGIRNGQLVVHYQPIVDLRRREVVGLEALVRWQHPELGLLAPELFMPLAESSGLVMGLGRWVLETACRQAASWHRQGLRLEIAVNVSVRQVTDPGFVDDVRRALETSGLPAESLLLEVTESAVMEDVEAAVVALTQIRDTGANIAIDDFGTGYSSLLYLKRYPISVVKIDRSFVGGLGRNRDDDAIVASVVSLSRAVGAVCIAEGLETPAQHALLVSLGCDRAQGFLLSPPVPAAQVPAAVDAAEAMTAQQVSVNKRRVYRAPQVAVPEEVLTHMRQLRQSGASYPTIAAALNQLGSLHPKGTRWHRTSVAHFMEAQLCQAPQKTS